jgi:hypothetical protein
MKLPDFNSFAPLIKLRETMGATEPGTLSFRVSSPVLTEGEILRLTTQGIDVSSDEVKEHDDGTLVYKNSRVLLYIRDVKIFGNKMVQDALPRYHVANCETLKEMRRKNRSGRYVVAVRSDGSFAINVIRHQREIEGRHEKLVICQNCLLLLAFDGFTYELAPARRKEIVTGFTIPRFFEKYPATLHLENPVHDSSTAPLNVYTDDFVHVSRQRKEEVGWKCELCRVDLQHENCRKYLHVHHKNGLKYDNRRDNLQVLCLGCHAEQDMHGHMRNHPEYAEFLSRFRPQS